MRSERGESDDLVVNTELTLISIIQGIALFLLTESAANVLGERRWDLLPYVGCGLLFVLVFWSRALIHTITVIGWPLDLGHNFLYIAATLVESIMFADIKDVRLWWLLGALFAVVVWGLFAYDLRMIRAAAKGGAAQTAMLVELEREQLGQVRRWMPLAAIGGAVIAAAFWPFYDQLVTERWHVALALVQLVGLAIYLLYVVRFFGRLVPLITAAKRER
jgi:hypothetical protein